MEMASFCLKIRHFFGFTWLTERSKGAGPPVIIQLSGAEPLATPLPVKPFCPFCHVAIILFDTAAASYSVVTYPALKSEFDISIKFSKVAKIGYLSFIDPERGDSAEYCPK
jgi:hypothetical protein